MYTTFFTLYCSCSLEKYAKILHFSPIQCTHYDKKLESWVPVRALESYKETTSKISFSSHWSCKNSDLWQVGYQCLDLWFYGPYLAHIFHSLHNLYATACLEMHVVNIISVCVSVLQSHFKGLILFYFSCPCYSNVIWPCFAQDLNFHSSSCQGHWGHDALIFYF